LQNQAEYIRSPESWMLNAFVLPVAKFDVAANYLSQFDRNNPLRISALGPKSESAAEFRDNLSSVVAAMISFAPAHHGVAAIDQLEMPLPPDCDSALVHDLPSTIGELQSSTFWETPADQAERIISWLANRNSAQGANPLGCKLRTGGVTADAFPTSESIARALVASAKYGVPIKFTAGLHHPIRHFREEVKTKMHGFLNVLGAGVLAAEHAWDEQTTTTMLEDENPASFLFDDRFFSWREWKIDTKNIQVRRKLVTSFGSCSFDEPREDLAVLKIL
ncbi:MAG: hypothetical protein QOI34_1194, partial [Verrucomicrobiota bacterium]